MAQDIRDILDSYHANDLKTMAEAAGLNLNPDGRKVRKEELLTKMEAEYFGPERVQKSLAQLDERERAALDRLLLHGGPVPTTNFKRELVRADLATEVEPPQSSEPWYRRRRGTPYDRYSYVGQPDRPDSTVFEDLMARLTYHGLVFSRSTETSPGGASFKVRFHPAQTLFIPPAIRRHLPDPEPIPSPLAGWQPPRVQSNDPDLFLRDLYLYWDFVRRHEVSMIQAGFVGKRGLKAINEVLLQPDPLLEDVRREDDTYRLYLLRQMLETLNLIRDTGSRLEITGRDALDIPQFWSRSQAEQLKACLTAWSQVKGLKDLGQNNDQYYPQYTQARKSLLAVLKQMASDTWLDPLDLLGRLQAKNLGFLLPDHAVVESSSRRGHSYSYYSNLTGIYYHEKREDLLKKFEQLEIRFIRTCISDFLLQLGLVELGYGSLEGSQENNEDRWRAFRLTPSGQAALEIGQAEPPEREAGQLVIQPNFQVMALGPVGLDLLAHLDLFARREQVDRRAFQYRLSRESVYEGQQVGLAAADIIQFLTEAGQTDLPQNVRRSLEEWGQHHHRIVFRTGVSLLQTATAELLNDLLDRPETGPLLARSLAPDVALIKDGRQATLLEALLEQDMLPAVAGDDPQSADRSVIVAEDGVIQPVHAVPGLHLRGRLAQLAEAAGDGTWRLTPASVRRAGGSRQKVEHLLAELDRLHRGGLPDRLVAQLKAWGGYYGRAAAKTLTLIEFSDQAALEELSQHPDLQPHLTPFPAGQRALAVVPADKLGRVKEILAGFGVTVKEGLLT